MWAIWCIKQVNLMVHHFPHNTIQLLCLFMNVEIIEAEVYLLWRGTEWKYQNLIAFKLNKKESLLNDVHKGDGVEKKGS